jgi:hypothetical protein
VVRLAPGDDAQLLRRSVFSTGQMNGGTRIFAEFLPSVILTEKRKELSSFMFIALSPFVSLIAGILILIFPRLLNFIVAIHLIIVGILGLLHR